MEITNKYVQRLANEWMMHKSIIIAVDYDDTISPWRFSIAELQDTIECIKQAQYVGAYVLINTACHPDRFPEIISYCNSIGIKVGGINETPEHIPYGKHGKVYANIFLDDRAGLEEAKSILRTAMAIYKGSSSTNSIQHIGEIA